MNNYRDTPLNKVRQLAEKIWGQTHLILTREEFISLVESLLTEFQAEVILDDRMKRTADDIYKLSRLSAYEEAAKVAESAWRKPFYPTDHVSGELAALRIRDAIRALAEWK